MMKISKYFTFYEATITKKPGNNEPSGDHIKNILYSANKLDKVREAIGKAIIPTSWFRSKEINNLAGGSKTSAHLSGYAIDFIVNGMTNYDICKAIIKLGIDFDQLIDETKDGKKWVHISFDPRNRKEWLIFNGEQYTSVE